MQCSTLSFLIHPFEGQVEVVTPAIDGRPLTALAAEYENERGYDVAGGYGGLIPAFFNYGDLASYFRGQTVKPMWRAGEWRYVLGCDCGEVGCWPLCCTIEVTPEEVIWRDFHNPHRQARDYSAFGPFAFARSAYEEALLPLGGIKS